MRVSLLWEHCLACNRPRCAGLWCSCALLLALRSALTWQPSVAAVIVVDVVGLLVGGVAEGQLVGMADFVAAEGHAGRAVEKQPTLLALLAG